MMIPLIHAGLIPDPLIRATIYLLNTQRLWKEAGGGPTAQVRRAQRLRERLRESPIAVATDKANEQHYELPSRFFDLVLGPHRKYSSGYWGAGVQTLEEAEKTMLDLYLHRAELVDGQEILDLGCGWGSLSLYVAQKFPNSRVTGLSNSYSQADYIRARAVEAGLDNLEVVTCDINDFTPWRQFDRIVSVEMLEHVRNYEALFTRLRAALEDEGKLFIHVFCHHRFAYLFEARNPRDWMERYFFSGGIMPSLDLLPRFAGRLSLEDSWLVNGTHYRRTADAWLQNMRRNKEQIMPIFAEVYGPQKARWWVYWQLFFLACSGLFGYGGGRQWMVAHYLFARA